MKKVVTNNSFAPLTNLFELFGHWYIENQSKDWFFCCYTPTFSLEVIQRNHPKRKDGEYYDKDYWAISKFWWFIEEEINTERKKYSKKEFVYKDETEKKHIKKSKTDPESGYYHRDNKGKGFMYLDHRTVDHKANIIVDAHVTEGNVHDSGPYNERLDYIEKTYNFKVEKVALDSGYDTLDIKKNLLDKGIFAVIGYRRYGTKESRQEKTKYYYDKELDIYVEKATGEVLEYKGKIDRLGYKLYTNEQKDKVIRRHICEEINEQFRDNRLSKEGKELYKFRKEKVERSFADSKQNHGYRYAMYRGLRKNQNYTWLICAAQNMKNISIKIDNSKYKYENNITKSTILLKINQIIKIIIKFLAIRKPQLKNNWGLSTIWERYFY